MADIMRFMGTLNAAVLTTCNDPAKWERFSRRVLADAHNPDTSQQLRTAFHSAARLQLLAVLQLEEKPRHGGSLI